MKNLRELFTHIFKKKNKNEKQIVTLQSIEKGAQQILDKQMDRRAFLRGSTAGVAAGATLMSVGASALLDDKTLNKVGLQWEEYFKGNYRVMTPEEQKATVKRLEELSRLNKNENISVSSLAPIPGVLYGYAFNISKCEGYMDCIKACVEENNLDRNSNMQYIKVFEMDHGKLNVDSGDSGYFHEVPKDDKFYIGMQCMHCENPPCVPVCPTGSTWKEKDGIVVIDYDWCIGCRYCQAACPYQARRFNWSEPVVPTDDLNRNQHYLGNRTKGKGVMEKCTFCVQRSRQGMQPACVEACPTGARVFGNLLDPNSEIRYIIENKKVFRMKEELGTEPKFWYYMD